MSGIVHELVLASEPRPIPSSSPILAMADRRGWSRADGILPSRRKFHGGSRLAGQIWPAPDFRGASGRVRTTSPTCGSGGRLAAGVLGLRSSHSSSARHRIKVCPALFSTSHADSPRSRHHSWANKPLRACRPANRTHCTRLRRQPESDGSTGQQWQGGRDRPRTRQHALKAGTDTAYP